MDIPSESLEFILTASLEKAEEYRQPYDKNFGDSRVCECGHPYYRHFDSYERFEPVGCNEFKEKI